MLTGRLHTRGLSCLMSVLFAMQIVAGGFCLLTADAHAMPQSVQTQDGHAHCVKQVSDQPSQEDSGSCYHCDQPDQLSGSVVSPIVLITLLLPDVMSLTVNPQPGSDATTGFPAFRTPTGPPRSSTLLYTTTQRIRI